MNEEGFNVQVPSECPTCHSENLTVCIRPNANMAYCECNDCGWCSNGLPHVDRQPRGRRRSAVADWAAKVKTRDRLTCRICGKKGGAASLEAHHIIPVKNDPNGLYTLDVNNGITLCKTCHQLVHK